MNMFSDREPRVLNNLSPQDRHLFLINDINQLLRDTILDYKILYDTDKNFEENLNEFDRYLSNMYEKVYKKESDLLKDKSDKDFWLLSALSRNEIARKAFNNYVEHIC